MPSQNNSPAPDLAQRLADSGLRSTAQREVVYRTLLARRDHPTAEEVFARAKSDMPSISLATVYNCLETLVACNLIRQVNHERSPTRYCPNLRPHAHFHDEATGATLDIDLPVGFLDQLKQVLPSGYSADEVELTFRGKSSSTGAPGDHS